MKICLILVGVMLLLMGLLYLLTRGLGEEEGLAETGTTVSVGTEASGSAGGSTEAASSEAAQTEAALSEAAQTEAVSSEAARTEAASSETKTEITYWFRTKAQRDQHYEKHGKEMGFASAEDYLRAANEVVKDPSSLHKIEKEDGDDVYYREADNAFVIVSTDGYIRTFFYPSGGKSYYDRQ
ncbi:MAG: hypothetical protein K5897_07270 [Eubacterium sp.]|nr:hypothetical protein [Eubacterium sp.]